MRGEQGRNELEYTERVGEESGLGTRERGLKQSSASSAVGGKETCPGERRDTH